MLFRSGKAHFSGSVRLSDKWYPEISTAPVPELNNSIQSGVRPKLSVRFLLPHEYSLMTTCEKVKLTVIEKSAVSIDLFILILSIVMEFAEAN